MEKKKKSRQVDRAWFDRRMAEKSLSLRGLAALSDINPSNLSRVMRGLQPLRIEQAILISEALDAPVELVLEKIGTKLPTRLIPVVGIVDDGLHVDRRSQRPVTPPMQAFPDLPLNAVSLVCTDTASPMRGWQFCFVESQGFSADAVSRLCVVQLGDGEELIRFVRPSLRIGRFDLLPLFGKRAYSEMEIAAATPVLHIRP